MPVMMISALSILLLSMTLLCIRAWKGPHLVDRMLALSSLMGHSVLVIVLMSLIPGYDSYVDCALTYAMLGDVMALVIYRFATMKIVGY